MGNSYKTSKYKTVYESIADDTNSTPERVYELAHGSHVKNHKDNEILSQLEKHHIINIRKTKHSKSQNKSMFRKIKKNKKKIIATVLAIIAIVLGLYYFTNYDLDKPNQSSIYHNPEPQE